MKSNKEIRYCVMSTMPRSGTWYNVYLWENLDKLVTGRSEYDAHRVEFFYPELNIHRTHSHRIFPDFLHLAKQRFVDNWSDLDFHTGGYDARDDTPNHYSIRSNINLSVIYVYRNPLDQIVSFYDHSINHLDKALMAPPAKFGSSQPYRSASDLAMRGGAESYLKQYLTFRYFADQNLPQLMMVKYEDQMRDPHTQFDEILRFSGANIDPDRRRQLIADAVTLSNPASVSQIEKSENRAIGDDQKIGDGQSHLRGGAIGKWRTRLSAEAVDYIWRLFGKYNVTESDFVLS